MFKRMISIQLISISVLLSQSCALAIEDANSLYQQGEAMERQGRLGDALAHYNRICSEFPNDTFAGPDNAGYRAKLVACRIALEKGDAASAKEIAEQIRTLPSSAKQKPEQLYSTGCSFDTKKLFSDALSFYQQVLSEYPNSRFAGPDCAGYNTKRIAYGQALESGDIVEARKIADEIRNLASSPEEKPAQLYSTGYLFEAKRLFSDALPFYQDINSGYPDSQFAGANYAGFKAKEIALMMSLESGDIVEARKIADEIRNLASSPEEKPAQLFWTGCLFDTKKLFSDALSFYQQVLSEYPNSRFAGPDYAGYNIKRIAYGQALESDDIVEARRIADEIRNLASSPEEKINRLFRIAEGYYLEGEKLQNNELLNESIEMFGNEIPSDPNNNLAAARFYMLGLNYWQLGEYFDAADAFETSIEADPNQMFAGDMHWLISDSYEKLKAAGDVNAVEADPIIEWGYQTLFDNYPNCNIIDYAAMRLSQINLDKGNEVAACGYYCWLLMKNDDPNGIGFVDAMFKKCEKCGGCGNGN
ncbi:MAG TPA: hypothetical protein DD726_02475 [Phycisphaerales bacterium]|nr:hypothetical protein [Phycisphaerales bacterium]